MIFIFHFFKIKMSKVYEPRQEHEFYENNLEDEFVETQSIEEFHNSDIYQDLDDIQDPNDYPECDDKWDDLIISDIQPQIINILKDNNLEPGTKIDFMRKFGIYYIFSKRFREKYDGYH